MDDDAVDAFDAFDAYTEDELQAFDAMEKDYFNFGDSKAATPSATPAPLLSQSALLPVADSPPSFLRPNSIGSCGDGHLNAQSAGLDLNITAEHPDRDQAPIKRGCGRPKGSKSHKTLETLARQAESDEPPKEKRPLGRPRGSGPKQLAKERDLANGSKRRPVGRPRKPYPTFGAPKPLASSSTDHGLRVPGLPATGPSYRHSLHRIESAAGVPCTGQLDLADADPAPHSNTTRCHDVTTNPKTTSMASPRSTLPHVSLSCGDDVGQSGPTSMPEPSLVPETDPSQIIEDEAMCSDNDEDDESRLMEEGLGEDEEEEGEEEDEVDGGNDRRPRRMPPLRPLPTWLQEVFDACVEESSLETRNHRMPPLYRDHKTFWFPRPANYFVLRDQAISPQKLYEYDIFLWDPMALVQQGIPCPNAGCRSQLRRLSHVPRPRRVVDLNKSFWIIGYRYRCKQCTCPNSITFRSWDPRILAVLPRALAAEFPARLTYRSGMALSALAFMRSCFQNGMGAKQVSNALRVQHLQNYDRIHLQYLHAVASRPLDEPLNAAKYKAFLPFDDRSPDGLHGFVPSAQWLRDIYDQFIEEHQDEFNQHTVMLTAKICAIDHSFKLTKHIAKVDGVQIFTALLTITNENGQMRICNLVATKSHSQFILALQRMCRSLELYGHDQPFLFFTDGMSDKDFLEKCFPSLRKDLVPVEKYSHLPPLQIPDGFSVSVKNSVTAINDTMRTILECLPEDDSMGTLTVGLDAEWNVELSERGYVTGRGQTAILQVAYGTNIYILQIGHMLAGQELPLLLKQVLTNPKINKVGCSVTADLKYLQWACQSSAPFLGGINLGMFAKDRFAVKSGRIGLADLCAVVLGKRLNKNVPERVSIAWEDAELTPAQLRYAALDAHASLEIYTALSKIPLPTPLPQKIDAGLPVLLFNNDRTCLLACGIISAQTNDTAFDGINLTSAQCVVEIREMLVPGAIISNGTSRKQALEEHGAPPFNIVCLRSHLRQYATNLSTFQSSNIAADDIIIHSTGDPESMATHSFPSGANSEDASRVSLSEVDGDESSQIGNMLFQTLQSNDTDIPSAVHEHDSDPVSRLEGEAVLHEMKSTWVPHIRSRVLKDPFHVFNMFYISAAHGLLREFAIALRDAIFIPDQQDKSRIIAWAQTQTPPKSWNNLLFRNASWLWRRCKRIIPPAEELYPLVAKVFEIYGPLKDAKSGLPLFNTTAWGVAKNVLELIRKGFLSDPPGIPLYYQVGVDSKTGLPLYCCMKGTNMTEGGVHTHLRSRLPTSGVSVRHVGTYNTTGQRYTGHFSIWLTNELQEMLCLVQHMLVQPRMITNWVNGNLYQRTEEVSGVLPIPNDIRSDSGMGAFFATLHSRQMHSFLASMQGTRKPVLPVHNSEERDLFRELMADNPVFNESMSGSNCDRAVQLWNAKADNRNNVSYKLTEQLRVYYNGDWKRNANIKQTKAMTANIRVPLNTSLRDPKRSLGAPPVPETSRTLPIVPKGLVSFPSFSDSQPTPSEANPVTPSNMSEAGSSKAILHSTNRKLLSRYQHV